ncbi:hypothetical protein [Sulfurimonas sp.]|jgi:hypothetical protein|uniref:hypothetical protein n=1 Tax=Sulfurimonas sp. TaxID=2022749 RepID=UPI0025ED93B6|nr:hypothetical protein [Sulfurimonas sp.]MCK9455641.1 hypothetical protein [Sulfurimonas sp.]
MALNEMKTFICAIDLETNEILYADDRCIKKEGSLAEKMICNYCPLERNAQTSPLPTRITIKEKSNRNKK